jgi:SAM-dependent methyltransferase
VNAQLDPRQVLDPDRFRDYELGTTRSPLIPLLLSRIDRPGLAICDVGGATGRFLDAIARASPYPISATVFDVMPEYREHLVDPSIVFLEGSIVDNRLPSASFDIVTARHVLHHLVSDSAAGTRALQRRGIAEMLRLTRPGGFLVFQEQVHYVQPLSRSVYYLSRFASRHRLRLRLFEAGKVVVSFMTPREIGDDVEAAGRELPLVIEAYSDVPRQVALKWKLTLLMASVGDVVYAIRRGA